MIRTISKTLAVPTVSELLADIVTGGAGYTRRIVGAFYETVANCHFRLYVNNDRVCEISGDIVNDASQPVMIDYELQDGDSIQAGYWNGTTGTLTQDISIQVEESPIGG